MNSLPLAKWREKKKKRSVQGVIFYKEEKRKMDQIYHVSVNPLRKITAFLHAGLFFCDPQLMFVSHVTEQLCMQILRCLTKIITVMLELQQQQLRDGLPLLRFGKK